MNMVIGGMNMAGGAYNPMMMGMNRMVRIALSSYHQDPNLMTNFLWN